MNNHKAKAAKSADLFHRLHQFIVPFILKTVFAFYSKYNIRNHNHNHKD